MLRSRWLALQAATVVLAAAAVPSVRAQGRCPFLMQNQLQLGMRFAPPPMMMPPPMAVPHFPPPMLTPPRMPMGFRPISPPMMPQHTVGMVSLPRIQTPALEMHVPRLNTSLTQETHTSYMTHVNTQFHTMRFPTLQWQEHTWYSARPSFVTGHGGYGQPGVLWDLAMGIRRIPTLGFGTVHWTSSHTTHTVSTETRDRLRLTTETNHVRIPSLSFNPRLPTLTTRIPVNTHSETGPRTHVEAGPVVGHNPAKTTPVNTKPAMGTPQLQLTGRFSMQCGSCHNCKAAPSTGMIAQQPAPSLPVFPALTPPVVQRPLLTYLGPPPVVTQPFAPLVLLPAPQPLPSLTLNSTLLTAVSSPPKITRSPGQALFDTPPPTLNTAAVVSSSPPTLVTALPQLVAELSPPALQKVERANLNQVQLPPLAEVLVPAERDKPAPARAAKQGPSLIYVLLEPPPLPSGALVTPREVVQPALDEPPVLPALVDTLIQPPPLPPVPGA
jgi:hypothetical protein